MIVVDASVLVNFIGLANLDREAADALGHEDLHAPEVVTVETASGLRGLHLGGKLSAERLDVAIDSLLGAPIQLHSSVPLFRAASEFWSNVSAYDAMYLALARELRCPFMTTDGRLAVAAAEHVEVVVPRTLDVA